MVDPRRPPGRVAVDLEGDRPGGCGPRPRAAVRWRIRDAAGARRSRAGPASRAARRRSSSYTWTSAWPSPGWPRGTTSRPRRNCPVGDHDGRGPAREPRPAVERAPRARAAGLDHRSRSGGVPSTHMLQASVRRRRDRPSVIEPGSAVPARPASGSPRPRARPRGRGRCVASGRKRTSAPGRGGHGRGQRARRRPATSTSGGDDVGLPHGSPGRIMASSADSADRDRARRGHDAAPAAVGRGPGGRRGLGLGRDLGDLAQQVDHLLHVAHEVAAGHLLVFEDVGEVVALGPRVDRGGEARDRAGGSRAGAGRAR